MADSNAERARRYRANRGARAGAHGPAPTEPCGTVAAYKRHLRHGEPTDPACRQAWADWQRQYHTRKKQP